VKNTVLLVLSALLVAVAVALGCERASAPVCGGPDGGGQVIDTDVMAYLSAARALHHEANVKEDSGDLAGAIAVMKRLIALPVPKPNIVEIQEVLADAHARLAELHIKAGDLDAATKEVETGLTHAKDVSYFRGHLFEVQGLAEEQRAKQLAAAGKTDEANRAKARAIELLEQAVDIQSKVIQRATGDGGSK
jgi:tetratricopeptide (TPR) repeat protein